MFWNPMPPCGGCVHYYSFRSYHSGLCKIHTLERCKNRIIQFVKNGFIIDTGEFLKTHVTIYSRARYNCDYFSAKTLYEKLK